jgi:hypothetical protein
VIHLNADWRLSQLARRGMLALGAHLSERRLAWLRNGLGSLEQGHWLARQGWVPNLKDRFAVFTAALDLVKGHRPLYLEFGVYKGRTMRWWSHNLTGDQARFVGFDTFTGLPEDWRHDARRGSFHAGRIPLIDDPRVSFIAGLFHQTLPGWVPPDHDQLIVNVDCDLYTSSRQVLDWLDPHLHPGTLVYFDDLFERDHEPRAMTEWLQRHNHRVRPKVMGRWGHHLLLEYR